MIELHQTDIDAILSNRLPDTDKRDYGRILLLCGSKGYTGAAALAAMGALRTGAGVVYLGVPESIYSIMAVKLTEPVVFPLPDSNGTLSQQAWPQICELLPMMDAVLVGPGLGRSEDVLCLVRKLLQQYTGPVVLDADGINAVAGHMDIIRDRTGSTVLTPHMGEFRRILDVQERDRETMAADFARKWNCVLLLKGHETIITDGAVSYRNTTGNPGMASGGSGDVLSGILVSFIGQKLVPLQAAACGAYLHGQAGDVCAKEIGQYGMLPCDLLQVLPRLLK